MAKLILEDGSIFEGISFGAQKAMAGEVVFSTGMTGYPEGLTDPSYKGQILILTYPLIGNYGVPDKIFWESDKIHISGLIVSNYIDTPSHFQSKQALGKWLEQENIPALEVADTRFLTQKIRTKGTMLGKIIFKKDIKFYDPNKDNLATQVSTKKITTKYPHVSSYPTPGVDKVDTKGKTKTILLIDCGAKENIARCLLKRNVKVITAPWDFDPFSEDVENRPQRSHARDLRGRKLNFDGIIISNGPGNPKMADATIETVKKALSKKIPILGICLGNQILALAAGGDTAKLKFGHRSQNQPCLLAKSDRCYITTQNHGFAISKIPQGFNPWFTNANDGTNEGIIHKTLPFMSVQFHPEANPGPTDTEWIFDYFLDRLSS